MVEACTSLLTIAAIAAARSEEHTSELQSQSNLVCRLLLEKKKPTSCTRLSVVAKRGSAIAGADRSGSRASDLSSSPSMHTGTFSTLRDPKNSGGDFPLQS